MSYIDTIGMKTHLKSLKNTFLAMFYISVHFRPTPAINRINKYRKNREKCQKIRFFKSPIIFNVVAGNMIFCRKVTLWNPESTRNVILTPSTYYDSICRKIKKIIFLIPKIMVKKFFEVDFFGL